MKTLFPVLSPSLLAVALLPGLAGQTAPLPSIPGALEEQIAAAMRSNPDILVAEAKLRQAQAELNAVRLKVTQDVLKAHQEQRKQAELIGVIEQEVAETTQRVQSGQATNAELSRARFAAVEAKAAFQQNEAVLRYLLGLGGTLKATAFADVSRDAGIALAGPGLPGGATPPPPAPKRPEVPEAFRAALEKAVDLYAGEGLPLPDALLTLQGDPQPIFSFDGRMDAKELIVRLNVSGVPLRAVLLALADQLEGICFVFRDYGIFVTTQERAGTLRSATIPEDVPLVGPGRQ
ncbi:MAG: hypothetical protein HY721_09340 [Planctomycetes bacterium]|nr:hypothetical protein [Planctomycetota bacterium]